MAWRPRPECRARRCEPPWRGRCPGESGRLRQVVALALRGSEVRASALARVRGVFCGDGMAWAGLVLLHVFFLPARRG